MLQCIVTDDPYDTDEERLNGLFILLSQMGWDIRGVTGKKIRAMFALCPSQLLYAVPVRMPLPLFSDPG